MRLLIRRRLLSLQHSFTIYDEAQRPKYRATNRLLTWGVNLQLSDLKGQEIGYVEQRLMTLLLRYDIFLHGAYRGQICRKLTYLFPRYEVECADWVVKGDLMHWSYTVTHGRRTVATIYKKLLSWGDTYVIDIDRPEDEHLALLLVLAIDLCEHVSRANAE